MKKTTLLLFILMVSSGLFAQQATTPVGPKEVVQSYDKNYVAPTPEQPHNSGTTIYVDAAHNNFHTYDGRFTPFSDLVKNDGFKVTAFTQSFSRETLKNVDILVIANPVNEANNPESNWVSPIQAAFTDEEITALLEWVAEGGSLLLIADHFPFPGAVDGLARELGFKVDNGYNFDPMYYTDLQSRFFTLPIIEQVMEGKADPNNQEVLGQIMNQAGGLFIDLGANLNSLSYWSNELDSSDTFKNPGDGELYLNSIQSYEDHSMLTQGIPFVTTFTGQSFTWNPVPGVTMTPIFTMGEGTYTVLTEAQDAYFGTNSTESDTNTLTSLLKTKTIPTFIVPVVQSGDKLQAALVRLGDGKVAFFGEAGMFTAQIAADGKSKMGMNNEQAQHNWKFVLQLMRFLD